MLTIMLARGVFRLHRIAAWKNPAVTVVALAMAASVAMPARGASPVILANADDASTSFTYTADIDRSVSEGQPAILRVALRNNTTKALFIGGSAFEEAANILSVTDARGKSVPRTAYGQRVLTPPTFCANSTVILPPGETRHYNLNVARLFDLSMPGHYTVKVERALCVTSTPWSSVKQPIYHYMTPLMQFEMLRGDVESGPEAAKAFPKRVRFLYTANQYDVRDNAHGCITRTRIGEDGRLSQVLLSAAICGGMTSGLTISPDSRYLYAANSNDGTVSQYRIGLDGDLIPLSPSTVPSTKYPEFLLMDPKGRFLYVMSGWGSSLYNIGPDGRLTQTLITPSEEWQKDREHLVAPAENGTINAAGNQLYAGQDGVYRLASDGRVTGLLETPLRSDDLPYGCGRASALTPDGRFAFILTTKPYNSANSNTQPDDLIVPMRIGADGRPAALPGAQTPKGLDGKASGSNALAVDPTGRFLLVLNNQYNFIVRYQIEDNGYLTSLGVTPEDGQPNAIQFDGRNHLVYVLNRSDNSISTYRLTNTGDLIPVGRDTPAGSWGGVSMAIGEATERVMWGEAVDGLAMTVRMENNVLSNDAPVAVTVLMKNTTQHPIALGTTGADMSSFRLTITCLDRNATGKSVALLAAGREVLSKPRKSAEQLSLPAGGERQYRLVLSQLADLSAGSLYAVQVKRVLPGGAAAASQTVQFSLQAPYPGRTPLSLQKQVLDIL